MPCRIVQRRVTHSFRAVCSLEVDKCACTLCIKSTFVFKKILHETRIPFFRSLLLSFPPCLFMIQRKVGFIYRYLKSRWRKGRLFSEWLESDNLWDFSQLEQSLNFSHKLREKPTFYEQKKYFLRIKKNPTFYGHIRKCRGELSTPVCKLKEKMIKKCPCAQKVGFFFTRSLTGSIYKKNVKFLLLLHFTYTVHAYFDNFVKRVSVCAK